VPVVSISINIPYQSLSEQFSPASVICQAPFTDCVGAAP